nr:hypothetical protein [Tanacetum cinerariifolium]
LGRGEVLGYFAQQGATVFEQVVHVLGFALKHVYCRFEGAGNIFGHYFFDLLKLVGHRGRNEMVRMGGKLLTASAGRLYGKGQAARATHARVGVHAKIGYGSGSASSQRVGLDDRHIRKALPKKRGERGRRHLKPVLQNTGVDAAEVELHGHVVVHAGIGGQRGVGAVHDGVGLGAKNQQWGGRAVVGAQAR